MFDFDDLEEKEVTDAQTAAPEAPAFSAPPEPQTEVACLKIGFPNCETVVICWMIEGFRIFEYFRWISEVFMNLYGGFYGELPPPRTRLSHTRNLKHRRRSVPLEKQAV